MNSLLAKKNLWLSILIFCVVFIATVPFAVFSQTTGNLRMFDTVGTITDTTASISLSVQDPDNEVALGKLPSFFYCNKLIKDDCDNGRAGKVTPTAGVTNSFDVALTGLTPNTKYDYEARILYAGRTGSFTTKATGGGGADIATATAMATPTADGATISGTVTGLTSTKDVTLSWGLTQTNLSSFQRVDFPTSNNYTYTITGLTAGKYYYQLYNQADSKDLTEIKSFMVGAGSSAQIITGATATAVPTDNSAEIFISIPKEYNQLSADVEYGISPTSFSGPDSGSTLVVNNGTSFYGMILGLKPNTTYYYDVYPAGDLTAPPMMASVAKFTTLVGNAFKTKLGIVKDFKVEKVTQTSASISGKIVQTNTPVSIIFGKQSILDYEHGPFTPAVDGKGVFTQDLVSLIPGTVYKVVAIDPTNESTHYSEVLNFRTEYVSATPRVSAIGQDTATITVTASDGATAYKVIYSKSINGATGPDYGSHEDLKGGGGTYTANLKGLTPDTNYSYKIIGVIDGKDVPLTLPYGFLTQQKPPKTTPLGTIVDTIGGVFNDRSSGTLIPCSGVAGSDEPNTGYATCRFEHIIKFFKNIINFLLFILAPVIAGLVMLYAGFLLLTAGPSTENVSKAKDLMKKALFGLAIALAAWVIVKGILVVMGYAEYTQSTGQGFPKFY